MLTWQPMRTDPCNGIYADTGGLGRYVIKTGDFIILKHNGEEIRKFGSQDEAKAYAQQAYESLGSIVFECSSCPNSLDTETNVWASAWSSAKREGWTAKREQDYWQNHCLRCSEMAEAA
jgi:hypothetical protein